MNMVLGRIPISHEKEGNKLETLAVGKYHDTVVMVNNFRRTRM